MAYKTNTSSGRTYNSSASGSQSPLSDTSDNTSPNSRTSHLDMPSGGRITPSRNRIDAPRVGASKGGCWYVPFFHLNVIDPKYLITPNLGRAEYAEK